MSKGKGGEVEGNLFYRLPMVEVDHNDGNRSRKGGGVGLFVTSEQAWAAMLCRGDATGRGDLLQGARGTGGVET